MAKRVGWKQYLVSFALLSYFAIVGFAFGRSVPHRKASDELQTFFIAEADGEMSVTDVIDFDPGTETHWPHGRTYLLDFGELTDIEATSDGDPVDAYLTDYRAYGSPSLGLSVQVSAEDRSMPHRFEITHRLRDADLVPGDRVTFPFLLERSYGVARFRGVISGLELSTPTCTMSPRFTVETTPCELTRVGPGVYETVVDDLKEHPRITVEATIRSFTPAVTPAPYPAPPRQPAPTAGNRPWLAGGGGLLGCGLATLFVYLFMRRAGRDEVYVDTPAVPRANDARREPTRLVPHNALKRLATIEFVPPDGIEPWEGNVLLRERVDLEAAGAYLATMAALGTANISPAGRNVTISKGDAFEASPKRDREWLSNLLGGSESLTTGRKVPSISSAMASAQGNMLRDLKPRKWWIRGPLDGRRPSRIGRWIVIVAIGILALVTFLLMLLSLAGGFAAWPWWFLVAAVFGSLSAIQLYRPLRMSRSAAGSAMAIQTESFRRFLHRSEAEHVEQAWKKKTLREYSAWAVALGEAKAWSRAVKRSSVAFDDADVSPLHSGTQFRSIARASRPRRTKRLRTSSSRGSSSSSSFRSSRRRRSSGSSRGGGAGRGRGGGRAGSW